MTHMPKTYLHTRLIHNEQAAHQIFPTVLKKFEVHEARKSLDSFR